MCMAMLVSSCGSNAPAATEQSAIENLHAVLRSYNHTTPVDVASTGASCSVALKDFDRSAFLSATPAPGKELAVRESLHVAYTMARQGFSDCVKGAKGDSYALMARADSDLAIANRSLAFARSSRG